MGVYRPEDDGRCRLGYNPAVEARSISKADWESVRSRSGGSSRWATAKLPWVVDGEGFRERAML
jgi:sterol carrier protein 2